MDIYELSGIIYKLKYQDYSSDEIKNINYNNREKILTLQYDKNFHIEVNLNNYTIDKVLDVGMLNEISIME